MTRKQYLLVFLFFFISCNLFSKAIKESSYVKYSVSSKTNISKNYQYPYTLTGKEKSILGYGVENTAIKASRLVPKGSYKSVDATYVSKTARTDEHTYIKKRNEQFDSTGKNGINGIDGLFLKTKNGDFTKARIIEVKSGKSQLRVSPDGTVQMSEKWILEDLHKAVREKNKILKNNTSEEIAKDLEKNIKELEKAIKLVTKGKYDRFIVKISYDNGKLTVINQQILTDPKVEIDNEGNKIGVVDKTNNPQKTVLDISLKEKDIHKLTSFQRNIRAQLLKDMKQTLLDSGYTESEAQEVLNKITQSKDATLPPEISEETFTEITKKSMEKVERKISKQQNIIKGAMIALVLINQTKAIANYINENISHTELVMETCTNLLNSAALMINNIPAPIVAVITIGFEVAKGFHYYAVGKMDFRTMIIDVYSKAAGLATAIAASAMIGSSFTGFGSLIVGAIVDAVVFHVSKKIITYVINIHDNLFYNPVYYSRLIDKIQEMYQL